MSTQRTFDRTHPLGRDDLARLVAADIPPGSYLNLGIGQPTRVADFLEPGSGMILHTENGMLGVGPQAYGDDIDPDLINAGKTPVTEMPGAAYFRLKLQLMQRGLKCELAPSTDVASGSTLRSSSSRSRR